MRLARRLGAILMALVLVAGVAGLVWADRRWLPEEAAAGEPEMVAVPPGDSTVVCVGAVKLPGDGEGEVIYDDRFDPHPTSVESITRGLAAGPAGAESQLLDSAAPPARISGQGRDIAVDNEPVEDAPIRLTAFAASFAAEAKDSPSPVSGEDSDDQPVAAGGTFQHLADGDLRGVAASACVPGGSEAWIVAGSTEPGSSARLLLTNPGFTTIWADLELWDGAGKREAMGLTGLTILPGTQKAVLLEGIVADAGRLAVHATASGGDLAVFLQHSRLEGLTPGGIELATPGALPATEVVVPGLNVTSSTFDSVRTSALRILSTGTEDANVSVELWGPDGPTSLPGLEEAVLHPEVVTDLSLGGLPGGHYTAVITSDQPVVAAALSLRAGEVDQPEEFAWTASALPSEQGYVALPTADLSYQLVAAAATDAQLEVRTVSLEGDLGEPETVELSGQTTESFDPAALGADQETVALQFRWLGGPGWLGLLVSASDEAGEMISALVPPALGAGWAEVRVYPR